ncbi:ABC transporter ATP-binding protein [Haloplanus ruber]|nr:ABC transporter ATP-binding protein [Haloplanus ruber]
MGALSLSSVSKFFGDQVGVADLTLDIEHGQTVVLFGHNGSGKTTLLRMLATLSRPTAGTISLDGTPLSRDRPHLRDEIGVVSHETYLYDELTARENLRLHARLHGVDPDRCAERLDAVGLTHRGSDPAGEFSHGMAKRLSFARATIHDPEVLLLDEPFSGLDRESRGRIVARLRDLDDTTLLVATHDLDRGFDLADRVLLLADGRRVGDVTTATCAGPAAVERTYERRVAGSTG